MILTITEISKENHPSREKSKSRITLLCLFTPHAANLGQITHHADNLGPITRQGKPLRHPEISTNFNYSHGERDAKPNAKTRTKDMKLAKKFTKTPTASSNCDNWKWHTTSRYQDVTHCQCYNKKICLTLCEVSCFCTQHNRRRDFRWRLPRFFPQTGTFQSISIIWSSIKRTTKKATSSSESLMILKDFDTK